MVMFDITEWVMEFFIISLSTLTLGLGLCFIVVSLLGFGMTVSLITNYIGERNA